MDVPATIAAEQAITKQNIALSVIKQSNDQAQRLVQILDNAARSAPINSTRGTNVNFSV